MDAARMILAGRSFTEGLDAFEGLSPPVRLASFSSGAVLNSDPSLMLTVCVWVHSKYRSMSARRQEGPQAKIPMR